MNDPTTTSMTTWLPLISAGVGLLTAVLGFASLQLSEWFKDRRAYKRESDARAEARRDAKLERSDLFQRESLLDLQTASLELMQASTKLYHFAVISTYKKGHDWLYPPELDAAYMNANAKTSILGVRVNDGSVRKSLKALKDGIVVTTMMPFDQAVASLGKAEASIQFVKLNERIGELLRAIDHHEVV